MKNGHLEIATKSHSVCDFKFKAPNSSQMTSTLRLVASASRPSTPLFTDMDRIDHIHAGTERSSLFSIATDDSLSWVVREPAILQLARRKDNDILDVIESFLNSDEERERRTAITALTLLGSDDALNRLIMLCACSVSEERLLILNALASCLTAEFMQPFSILVRDLLNLKKVDVTGWTSTAVKVLRDTCRRFGVKILSSKKTLARLVK